MPAVDEVAEYDAYLLPPLDSLGSTLQWVVGTIERSGTAVTVTVDDTVIETTFLDQDGKRHCAESADLPGVNFCFFQAGGEPALDHALGAVFRPDGNQTFAVIAHRRGVARPCSSQGHYPATVVDSAVTAGDDATGQTVVDAFSDYVAYFEIGDKRLVVLGDIPKLVVVEVDPVSGQYTGSIDDYLDFDGAASWDLRADVVATFELADDGSGSVTVDISANVSEPGGSITDTTVEFTLSGDRI
jgi:hypothetical protein